MLRNFLGAGLVAVEVRVAEEVAAGTPWVATHRALACTIRRSMARAQSQALMPCFAMLRFVITLAPVAPCRRSLRADCRLRRSRRGTVTGRTVAGSPGW